MLALVGSVIVATPEPAEAVRPYGSCDGAKVATNYSFTVDPLW